MDKLAHSNIIVSYSNVSLWVAGVLMLIKNCTVKWCLTSQNVVLESTNVKLNVQKMIFFLGFNLSIWLNVEEQAKF